MPWFVISTFNDEDDEDTVTWRAIETPFPSLADAWEAVSREYPVFDGDPDAGEPLDSVHVIEAKSMRKALDSLDLPV